MSANQLRTKPTCLPVATSLPYPWAYSLAGAPAASSTFFCDANSTTCYTLLTTAMSQREAKARCTQMGGQLVAWTTPERQFEAER